MNHRIHRRTFLTGSAAATAALGSTVALSATTGLPLKNSYQEPSREIPIVDQADVVVCGAGPAGIAAAVGAARAGAKTRLLEVNGCLGGVWTSGLLSWILDAGNKTGLMQEILARLDQRGASAKFGSSIGYDCELMKLLLEQMAVEAGVKIQLHSRVVATAKDDSNRLRLVVTESKSGRQAWSGCAFVDATGDGDLAARAGCGFDYGRPQSGETQPLSMIVILVGIEPDEVSRFVRGLAEPQGERDPKARLLEEMQRAGVEPSYARPTLFHIRQGLFCMMANHEYGVAATDAAQITEATIRARQEVHRLVDGLRSLGGVWKNVQIVATPEHVGVREGRRIHGLYQVTTEDLIQGARHDDAVCRVTFPVDVHSTDPNKEKGIMREGVRAKPYDIPYRALVARDVEGLLVAGRPISGDFVAHSSYRVTGNAAAMGEAAGVAAALAAKTKRLPREVPWPKIQETIEAIDKLAAVGGDGG